MPLKYNKHHHQRQDIMRIFLEDNDIYQSGQTVRGTIVVDLVSDVPFTDCFCKLYCLGKVGWTENPGLRDEGHAYNVQRKLTEDFFQLNSCKCNNI